MTRGRAGKWRWVWNVVLGLGLLAIVGLGVSAFLFSRWSDIRTVPRPEAEEAFGRAVEAAGGGPAYLEVSPAGKVTVRRELERPEAVRLRTLHLLAWEPGAGHLVQVAFPFWFVRLKMSGPVDLGMMTSALAQDWKNLDLSVSVKDLERLGPGLVLDERTGKGARIVLWTE